MDTKEIALFKLHAWGIRLLNVLEIHSHELTNSNIEYMYKNEDKKLLKEFGEGVWKFIQTYRNELTKDDLRSLAFRAWQEDEILWLIPSFLYETIPNDLVISGIYDSDENEEPRIFKVARNEKGEPNLDDDIRFGVLAYGLILDKPKKIKTEN